MATIGETEKVTKGVIERRRKGALFVDEAYRLTPEDNPKYYGHCALNELMKTMDSHDSVMIFAVYPKEMASFFIYNEGLYRRIPFRLKLS